MRTLSGFAAGPDSTSPRAILCGTTFPRKERLSIYFAYEVMWSFMFTNASPVLLSSDPEFKPFKDSKFNFKQGGLLAVTTVIGCSFLPFSVVDGDSCSTDYMAVNLSDFCTDTTFFGGTYSSDGCTISDNLGALEYTVDGNAITLTIDGEINTGEWSIMDNTLDLFFGGDSGCIDITGTKQ